MPLSIEHKLIVFKNTNSSQKKARCSYKKMQVVPYLFIKFKSSNTFNNQIITGESSCLVKTKNLYLAGKWDPKVVNFIFVLTRQKYITNHKKMQKKHYICLKNDFLTNRKLAAVSSNDKIFFPLYLLKSAHF